MVDIFDKVKSEAQSYLDDKENQERTGGYDSDCSIVWLMEGLTKFRAYIDTAAEMLMRSIYRHKIGDMKILCTGEGCQVCAAAEKANAMGFKGAWRFRVMEFVLMIGCIYEAKWMEADADRCDLIGEPVILMQGWKFREKMMERISECTRENMEELFDVDAEAPMFELNFKKGKKGTGKKKGTKTEMNLSFSMSKAELPELPDDFPSLNDLFTNLPTDQEVQEAVAYIINTAKAAVNTKVVDPEKEGSTKSQTTSTKKKATGKKTATGKKKATGTAKEKVPAESTSSGDDSSVSESGNTCFGSYDPSPRCITCVDEEVCMRKSGVDS